MDEVSNCAHLLSQRAPLNSPIVCKKDGLSFGLGEKKGFGLTRTSTALNMALFFSFFFPTGNAAYDIQLGGKSQYLHSNIELMICYFT